MARKVYRDRQIEPQDIFEQRIPDELHILEWEFGSIMNRLKQAKEKDGVTFDVDTFTFTVEKVPYGHEFRMTILTVE